MSFPYPTIVHRSLPAAHRTFGTASLPGEDIHHKGGLLKLPFPEADLAEYEPLEVFQLIEYCFDKHWVPPG